MRPVFAILSLLADSGESFPRTELLAINRTNINQMHTECAVTASEGISNWVYRNTEEIKKNASGIEMNKPGENPIRSARIMVESKTGLISTLNKCKIMFALTYIVIWVHAFTCLSKNMNIFKIFIKYMECIVRRWDNQLIICIFMTTVQKVSFNRCNSENSNFNYFLRI